MIILGINAYHGDSSACILKDGKLLFAIEEERLRRIKHWAGFPAMSIKACLDNTKIRLQDVDHIAINQNKNANFYRKLWFSLSNKPNFKLILERIKNRTKKSSILVDFEKNFSDFSFGGGFHEIEHHLTHMSSAFHVSPFRSSSIVSVDGFGDFASTAWGKGDDSEITIDKKIYFPHSLGVFYQSLTQWLGFNKYGDEYKVMGLAPYGKNTEVSKLNKIIKNYEDGSFKLNLDYFRHHSENVPYKWENCEPKVGMLYSEQLLDLLGPARKKNEQLTQYHFDIAKATQFIYEESFFNIINTVFKNQNNENISLAGGCANNSVANGKIYKRSPFKNVYVQSAAGDAGGALGAAFALWHMKGGKRVFSMDHAYWGPGFTNDDFKKLISKNKERLDDEDLKTTFFENESLLFKKVAKFISKGMVIGFFQEKMEWGPRALGNRSILGDPRRSDMKDILNKKIKRRESFRPFAPSVLSEEVKNWFEEDDDVPFMMQVFKIKNSKRKQVPAITHVDGTGRLQTVSEKTNYRYYNLIKEFFNITGVPMILNTSFNENEPVVCNPDEAINCFLRTNMDVLVLGNWIIKREGN